MKSFSLLVLLSCLYTGAFSQAIGRVLSPDHKPVEQANVILIKVTDSALAKMTYTDSSGRFRLLPYGEGSYLVQVSCVGYRNFTFKAFQWDGISSKLIGDLILVPDTARLSDVVIRAEKPLFTQTPAGIVVQADSSILTKGSTVLEVLERSPGVTIDHRYNDISLNGKTGVTVLLNGKVLHLSSDQVLTLLNSMSADDIDKIELLNTPGAQYDAQGSAGVINIVLKKNKRLGTYGNLSVTGGSGWGDKEVVSASLSHNTRNLHMTFSYDWSHTHTISTLNILSSQDEPFMGGQNTVMVRDTTKAQEYAQDANLDLDLKLGEKSTLSAGITYNNNHSISLGFNHSTYDIYPDSLLTYYGISKQTNDGNNLLSSLNWERKWGPGEKLTLQGEYLRFVFHSPSTITSSFQNPDGENASPSDSLYAPAQKVDAQTLIQVGVLKMDYTRKWKEAWTFNVGFKGTHTADTSMSGIYNLENGKWVSASELYTNIHMREDIGAGYLSVHGDLKRGVSLEAGLRYEYDDLRTENSINDSVLLTRSQGRFFPSLYLTKQVSADVQWQFSYTERITRPSYNDLASYVGYSDPTAVFTGNPLLQPTITRNLKLGYVNHGYSFSMLYDRENDPIAYYQLTESPSKDILYISPQNEKYQNNLSLQAVIPIKVNSWWHMSYFFMEGYRQVSLDYTLNPLNYSYFFTILNGSETFSLRKHWALELSGWYTTSTYNGTSKLGNMGELNAGIKKEFSKWGTLSLSATDLLKSMHWRNQYGTLTQEAYSIKNQVDGKTESAFMPILKLTWSKSFGHSTGATHKSNVGASEEVDRIRKG